MQLLLMRIWNGLFLFYLLSVKFSQLSYISILLAAAGGGGSGNTTGNRTHVGEEERKWVDENDANILNGGHHCLGHVGKLYKT